MEQADLLRRVIGILEKLNIPYMVVGSVASSAYGEPRFTLDIDIVIEIRTDQVNAFCEAFPENEYYVSPEAAMDAVCRGSQFHVIHSSSGGKVDFMIAPKDMWGRTQFSRREMRAILPDQQGYVARPEDIILSKMRYYQEGGSEKHLRDITGMLKVSGQEIDRAYVARWAEQLGVTEIWQAILRRLGEAKPL